eukprot:gene14318-45_t
MATYPRQVTPEDFRHNLQVGAVDLTRAALVKHPQHTVEVHFTLQYQCCYGQYLAVLGSAQGWQTAAAVPMKWNFGDKWTTVMSLPVGSDVEYKYVVMEDKEVNRWQDGPNNKLALHCPVTSMTALANDFADDVEAREAAFAGVHEALEKSAALLDALADPTHPLMLAADRQVAAAKTHMGQLLGDSGTVVLLG